MRKWPVSPPCAAGIFNTSTQKNAMKQIQIFAALLISVTSLAQAQTAGLRNSSLFKACGADLRQHCANVAPGGGRVLACLQSHEAELKPACKAELPQLALCQQELKRLCGDATPEQSRSCFADKREQFSAACRAMAPGG
jgi:Cysteine rich repeat